MSSSYELVVCSAMFSEKTTGVIFLTVVANGFALETVIGPQTMTFVSLYVDIVYRNSKESVQQLMKVPF